MSHFSLLTLTFRVIVIVIVRTFHAPVVVIVRVVKMEFGVNASGA